jgi:fido (protein-threonine AMPylation protein)
MATPQEKLANSLEKLQRLQDEGRVAIRSRDLTRVHRERLAANGFLQEVMKGWYIPLQPDDRRGESTPWYTSFWDFCADYCQHRFGDEWCMSPEQSISIHVGNRRIAPQIQIRTPKGGNKPIDLPHQTSIFPMRLRLPSQDDIARIGRLNLYKLPTAIIEAVPTFFVRNSTDARAALAAIPDASHVLTKLLDGGRSRIAGRLCGAFRNIGRETIADDIHKTMESAGYDIREADPFEEKFDASLPVSADSPHAGRIRLMWEEMRHTVIKHFSITGLESIDVNAYMADVEDAYVNDAYHSLSIEGYRVSPNLIEKIRQGQWNPDQVDEDRQNQDALAANGYYRAFQAVKQSVLRVLHGQDAGDIARQDHGAWYRELFAPLVAAGALRPATLAGYREGQVFLRASRHVPASHDELRDIIPVFFDLLENEQHPAVRVVLGHFVFVYVHPYMDGNGRVGRFLMNVMLAAGGYPWTVIPVDRRDDYMASLEAASVDQDIAPFAQFLANLVEREMEGNSVATLPSTKP